MMHLLLGFWSNPILVDFADDEYILKEQDLLLHLIDEHPKLRERIGWVQLNLINGYGWGLGYEKWNPGQLAIHFPSCVYRFSRYITDYRQSATCSNYFNEFWPLRQILEGELVNKTPPALNENRPPASLNSAIVKHSAFGKTNQTLDAT
jgi:hypothetical protein